MSNRRGFKDNSFWLHPSYSLDVISGNKIADPFIQISDGQIVTISNHPNQSNQIIELPGVTLLPGLIDAHTHLTYHFDANNHFGKGNPSFEQLYDGGVDNAEATLNSGFTTVRDLGAPGQVIFRIRDEIYDGQLAGPQRIATGPRILASGDPLMPDQIEQAPDLERLVSQHIFDGADVIKVFLDADDDGNVPLSSEEMELIVDVAADFNRKVAVHAHDAVSAKLAIQAGAASIEHGTFLDSEAIQMMVDNGTFLVPTLYLPDHYLKNRSQFTFPPDAWDFFNKMKTNGIKSAAKAIKAGVKIAYGTDAVAGISGNNCREFEYLMKAGMTPMEALQSATTNAAELLGLDDLIGQITPGYLADLVGIKGEISNPKSYENVVFVMSEGNIIRQ